MQTVMIATLGGQPQLITFALDELLQQGEAIPEVIILYLSKDGSRVNQALALLAAEFTGDYYTHRNHPCRFRPMPLRDDLHRLEDIQTKYQASAVAESLRDLILTRKQEQQQLHVCVSGGRRMLSLLLTSIAQAHFSHYDKLWHIYTPDETQQRVRNGAVMHAQLSDGVRLLEVPLIPLGTLYPIFQQATKISVEPGQQQVVAKLKERPLTVLKLIAMGATKEEVATKLHVSKHTVDSHVKTIYHACREVWPEREISHYSRLREWFGTFFR
jgi:CRISPR-associated protein Csx14